MLYDVNILLFDDFETLDVFGPVEILGCMPENFKINYISMTGGIIKSFQNVKVETTAYIKGDTSSSILMVPGGRGTRSRVSDEIFIDYLMGIANESKYILSVCTGSALLAKAGVLNGKDATSNKRAFDWAMSQSDEVNWIRHARWVRDGNVYTSSGVSAGIDMALGFISDIYGESSAEEISKSIEYIWNKDKKSDPFA